MRRIWSCSSALSQVTEQVGHILIHVGFLRFARGSCGSGSLLRGALPLLAEAEMLEGLMQLHLPAVVGRLLANHMS